MVREKRSKGSSGNSKVKEKMKWEGEFTLRSDPASKHNSIKTTGCRMRRKARLIGKVLR